MKRTKVENHQYFTSPIHYRAFRKAWKTYINQGDNRKSLTYKHHLVYNMLCGSVTATPITNKIKLANGAVPYEALDACVRQICNISVSQDGKNPEDRLVKRILLEQQNLLLPFGDTMTIEHINHAINQIRDTSKWEVL